jgi:hypothetical protein
LKNKAISSGITMTAPGFTSRFFRSTALSGVSPEQGEGSRSQKPLRKKSPTQFASLEPRVLFDAAAERTAAAVADLAMPEHDFGAEASFNDLIAALDATTRSIARKSTNMRHLKTSLRIHTRLYSLIVVLQTLKQLQPPPRWVQTSYISGQD